MASERRVNEQLKDLEATKALIAYKKWYYETAIRNESESSLRSLDPEALSKKERDLYYASHGPFKNTKITAKDDLN